MSDLLLEVTGLETFYGDFQALHGVSFSLRKGELLSLIGANGAGKSTLLKALCGLVKASSASIRWRGRDIGGE